MKFRILIVLLFLLPIAGERLLGQANPVENNSVTTQQHQFSVFMDPVFGYGKDESAINFNSRNYWMGAAQSAPTDAAAWFNYYRATRYIAEGSAGFEELQADLDRIDQHLHANVPGTWEQLIVAYWNSNRNPEMFGSLERAYALRPSDPLSLRFMIGMEFLKGKSSLAAEYYSSWKESGDAPVETERYAYNVMQSLPQGAVIFTNGELDSYPLLYQLNQSGNVTIKVVGISFCSRAENRMALFTHAGLVLPNQDTVSPIDANFIARVAEANPGKKVYVAATCGGQLLREISGQLYCTGLAYRYSEEPLDHLTFLRNNVGTKMNLSEVGEATGSQHRFDVNYADKLEMNYYLPLLLAADSYSDAGNSTRAKELRTKARSIRIRAGYEEPIRDEGLSDE